jgi:predicted permease
MRLPWKKYESDLEREMAHHLAELTDEYVRRGHPLEEARRLAREEFGHEALIKDQCRDESGWAWLEGMMQDLRFGLRQLRQAKVVTVAAVVSLALGIGANAALLTLMNTVLWKQLPLPQPEQLVLFHWHGAGFADEMTEMASGSMYKDGAERVADFFSMASVEAMRKAIEGKGVVSAYTGAEPASVNFAGRASIAHNRPVDGAFFQVLGVKAELGRTLQEADGRREAAPVVVVTHRLFESYLGGDPGVIGKTMRIDNKSYEIVGVLPESFYGLVPGDPAQMYSPMWQSSNFAEQRGTIVALANPRAWVVQVIGRLHGDVTQAQIQRAWEQSWDIKKPLKKVPQLRMDPGDLGLGDMRRGYEEPLKFLAALLGLVLLIACANIANLLLARATARAREVALRMSLGCSRGRILRQFLTESSLLALMGGVASLVVAYAAGKGLVYYMTDRNSPEPLPFGVDLVMLGAVATFSMLTLFLFGIYPAWRASRLDTNAALKEGSGSIGAAARHWFTPGKVLIVAQMSLALVLVSAAVLFSENLRNLAGKDTGFARTNLLVFDVRPGTTGYTKEQLPAFYRKLEQALRETPGVEIAAMATMRPMNQGGWWDDYQLLGGQEKYSTAMNAITPSYLGAFTPQLKAGRNFSEADMRPGAAKVAIISEDLAKRIDAKQYPIGRRMHSVVRPGTAPEPVEVIGVAPAIAFNSMKERPYVIWRPFELDAGQATVVLKTKGSPAAVLPAVRQMMTKMDENLPMKDVFTMEQLIARNMKREEMFATLCGSFGVLAMVLSVVGLYGVMSYNASRRKNEIGVRLALGADRGDVMWMVLREALGLTLIGMAIGSPAIYFGAQYLEKELFELKPLDPVLLGTSVALLVGAATIAALLPARRAAGMDPAMALRQD